MAHKNEINMETSKNVIENSSPESKEVESVPVKSVDEVALKYANDFVFPVKGVQYSYSYLQELRAQRDVIKDAYLAGVTNPIEVIKKRVEDRIKELVKTKPQYSNARMNELLDILKLIQ